MLEVFVHVFGIECSIWGYDAIFFWNGSDFSRRFIDGICRRFIYDFCLLKYKFTSIIIKFLRRIFGMTVGMKVYNACVSLGLFTLSLLLK